MMEEVVEEVLREENSGPSEPISKPEPAKTAVSPPGEFYFIYVTKRNVQVIVIDNIPTI